MPASEHSRPADLDEELLQRDAMGLQRGAQDRDGDRVRGRRPRRLQHLADIGPLRRREVYLQPAPRPQPTRLGPGPRLGERPARAGASRPVEEEQRNGHSSASWSAETPGSGPSSQDIGRSIASSVPPAQSSRVRSAPGIGARARTTW